MVPRDTRLDENSTGLRTPEQVESVIAQMSLVLTTRPHGMVLALKNGVPVIVVDPIAGGAKVIRQAHVLRWPAAVTVDQVTTDVLDDLLAFCLSEEARSTAPACRDHATRLLRSVRRDFIRAIEETK